MLHDPEIFDSLSDRTISEILQSWNAFVSCSEVLLGGNGDLSAVSELANSAAILCQNDLRSLWEDYFLQCLENVFRARAVVKFWQHFDRYSDVQTSDFKNYQILVDQLQDVLSASLEETCSEKNYLEKCLLILVHSLQNNEDIAEGKMNSGWHGSNLLSRFLLMVSSVLLTTLPSHFPEVLRQYFKLKLEELNTMVAVKYEDGLGFPSNNRNLKSNMQDQMNIDGCHRESAVSKSNSLVKSIGKVVLDLRNLGFIALTEDAYASSIIQLLKDKVQNLAVDDYRTPVLQSIKEWIQAVPLQFLHALLAYLGDSFEDDNVSPCLISPLASRPPSYPGIETPSEGLIRWQLRLEYFAYETLQDLRIGKLFEIIVDYPDSSPAIEDLKQCLDYTGQHSKLVDSFISSLRYRLLTAGASTNDILHHYVSTIKALRTIDPTGVFLETVGEPIREYLRGRKDTIKCIVTMLTDGNGGNPCGVGNTGDSLLEELNREAENQEIADTDEDINVDDKQAWVNAERWEPDPVEADPLRGSRQRGKIDILEMLVSIIGSKDQLVNEYRVMLAEKLLNKSDYEIDSEIRTLELLKIHFGESSMQKCEIMVNDLISSKRMNANIKASKSQSLNGSEQGEAMSLDLLDATIISSNFWPPIQEEPLHFPSPFELLLSNYAERFHEIKAPRKLLWKKNLGTIKLELQFDDRNVEFSVTPLHAAIIMQFQEKTSWTSKNLAAAVGLPVDVLNKRVCFWISKGVITDTGGADSNDHVFTLVDNVSDANRNAISNEAEGMDEEGERSVVSAEEQLQKEMTVYQKFIEGMLTNFGSMTLDRIHNTLKMFCVAEPSYDKSLQQLESFLAVLTSEEKLDIRDGQYFLKK